MDVAIRAFASLTSEGHTAIAAAAQRYGAFVEMPAEIDIAKTPAVRAVPPMRFPDRLGARPGR